MVTQVDSEELVTDTMPDKQPLCLACCYQHTTGYTAAAAAAAGGASKLMTAHLMTSKRDVQC